MPSERDCVDHLIRVAGDRNLSLQETIALGLLVARKWHRASAASPDTEPPTPEMAIRHDDFTISELHEFRSTSSRMLLEYGTSVYAAALPKPSWWYGVGQGVAGALFYSLIVAVILFIIKLSGSDVLTILRSLVSEK
jgi:hypothetical protein